MTNSPRPDRGDDSARVLRAPVVPHGQRSTRDADRNNLQLPECKACGIRATCNLVILGNDERWYLCPYTCFPALLADCREWLVNELRHNEQLAEERGATP